MFLDRQTGNDVIGLVLEKDKHPGTCVWNLKLFTRMSVETYAISSANIRCVQKMPPMRYNGNTRKQ